MMRLRRRALPALATGLAAPAWGQAPFPSRPVVMIVPGAPGGPTDVVGRILVQHMPAGRSACATSPPPRPTGTRL